MNTTVLRRTGVAAMALTVSFGLAACGSSDEEGTAAESPSAAATPTEESSPTEETSPTEEAATGEFGAGCAAVPTDPSDPGSFEGMAQEPVATAASNNEVLSTLVEAVGAANLGDTLNGLEAATVFAPANDAFAAVPEADLTALLADTDALTTVLTYHVVPERIAPEDLAGTFTTVQGEDLTVEGSGEEFTVGENAASVICGNVQTANATVYIIDGVLMPPAA